MKNKKGFTLLELLIVVAILAILAVILILVLNPAETMKQSRDTQRLSDMATLKTALGLYVTQKANPSLDGQTGNNRNQKCVGGSGTITLWVSVDSDDQTITDTPPSPFAAFAQSATPTAVNGSGWIPVNFNQITGGSPISHLPVDPVNRVADVTNVTNADLIYRYACSTSEAFEINARMESSKYGPGGEEDKAAADGGNNPNLYEVGTDLTILPSSNDF